ncbi:MAG: hydrogenase [Epsilonproteobacteria bacterium]|nr:hydrogenase [Campylobacterota bacterium]
MQNRRVKLLWLSAIACNGNAHSFLNYPNLEQFLKDFSFVYHPILESLYSLEDIINKQVECDILLIEGAISPEFKKANTPIINLISKYANIAKKVITIGTCATFGGIFKESGYRFTTGLHFEKEKELFLFSSLKDKTISLSGCPIHPEVLVSTLYAIKEDLELHLDRFLRPKEFYAYTIHSGCTRNEYFEYKIDNHQFGRLEGCMFYEHGCQAPFSHGSCNRILWNGVNSKTRNGEPCHGCTEPDFPKQNLFRTKKNMGVPQFLPLGVSKRAYLTLAGVTKAFKIKRLEEDLF